MLVGLGVPSAVAVHHAEELKRGDDAEAAFVAKLEELEATSPAMRLSDRVAEGVAAGQLVYDRAHAGATQNDMRNSYEALNIILQALEFPIVMSDVTVRVWTTSPSVTDVVCHLVNSNQRSLHEAFWLAIWVVAYAEQGGSVADTSQDRMQPLASSGESSCCPFYPHSLCIQEAVTDISADSSWLSNVLHSAAKTCVQLSCARAGLQKGSRKAEMVRFSRMQKRGERTVCTDAMMKVQSPLQLPAQIEAQHSSMQRCKHYFCPM